MEGPRNNEKCLHGGDAVVGEREGQRTGEIPKPFMLIPAKCSVVPIFASRLVEAGLSFRPGCVGGAVAEGDNGSDENTMKAGCAVVHGELRIAHRLPSMTKMIVPPGRPATKQATQHFRIGRFFT